MTNVRLSYAGGFLITFLVGGFAAFLSLVATQAMNGNESFSRIAVETVFIYVAAFGIGSLIGFITLVRSHFKTFACIVAGFVAGGAIGGLLFAVGVVRHVGALWVLGPIVPFAVGAFVAWKVAPTVPSRREGASGTRPQTKSAG